MTKRLHFAKMHALGNDFVMLDGISQPLEFSPQQVAAWADRRCGIGFDQLLTLQPPQQPDEDFFSQIYNADGSPAQSCYNGARCLALFARVQRLSSQPSLRIGFAGGTLNLTLDFANWQPLRACPVQLHTEAVDLHPGTPLFAPDIAPGQTIELAGEQIKPWLVGVGNPHAIVEVAPANGDADGNDLPARLSALGAAAQSHRWFPQGVNLSLVQRQGEDLQVSVYERGAGLTPACGTAAVAVGALALQQGWQHDVAHVRMNGEVLEVETLPDKGILLRGDARLSYKGYVLI